MYFNNFNFPILPPIPVDVFSARLLKSCQFVFIPDFSLENKYYGIRDYLDRQNLLISLDISRYFVCQPFGLILLSQNSGLYRFSKYIKQWKSFSGKRLVSSRSMKKTKTLNYPLFIFISGTVLLLLGGSYVRIFEKNELDTLDMRFRLRGPVPVTDKVAIVEIGDDTLEKLGRFPFDRRYHALLINVLSQYGARAVLFDIFFSEPDENDAELEQAIKKAGNVYLPYVFDVADAQKQRVPQAQHYAAQSLENLQRFSAGGGHINVFADGDGKYRRAPPLIKYKEALYPYLSLRLVSDYLGIPAQDITLKPGQYVQLGPQIRIPLDDNSNMMVNYAGEWGKFYQHYSYLDVLRSYLSLQAKEKPALDLDVFRDKICLIGLTATGTADLHPTAFASLYPALAIHADLINSILTHRFITRVPKAVNLLMVLICAGLIAAGVLRSKPFKGFLIFTGLLLVYGLSSILLFSVV